MRDRFGFVEVLNIEWTCLKEFVYFSRRHFRYLIIGFYLYGYSLFNWRRARAMRVGFCYLQFIDDILDGDRIVKDPRGLAMKLAKQIESEQFTNEKYSLMAEFMLADLLANPRPGDDPKGDLLNIIETMVLDFDRSNELKLMTTQELNEQHRKTFYYSLNLLFMSARAEVRAGQVPELLAAFGWCSTMRDLEEDLSRGLVNIPSEVVNQLGHDTDIKNYEQVAKDPEVVSWIKRENDVAIQNLRTVRQTWNPLKEKSGFIVLNIFVSSMEKFHAKMQRKYLAHS